MLATAICAYLLIGLFITITVIGPRLYPEVKPADLLFVLVMLPFWPGVTLAAVTAQQREKIFYLPAPNKANPTEKAKLAIEARKLADTARTAGMLHSAAFYDTVAETELVLSAAEKAELERLTREEQAKRPIAVTDIHHWILDRGDV